MHQLPVHGVGAVCEDTVERDSLAIRDITLAHMLELMVLKLFGATHVECELEQLSSSLDRSHAHFS